MGVQIDLPLTPAERDALLTHCNSTAASTSAPSNGSPNDHRQDSSHQQNAPYYQGPTQHIGSGQGQGQGQGISHGESQSSEAHRATGRNHGEILYQYQQQQYHLHQERISEAQMQQAYYSLSVASQDVQNNQNGGSFEELCDNGQDGASSSSSSASASKGDRGSGSTSGTGAGSGSSSLRSRESAPTQLQQHVKEEDTQSYNDSYSPQSAQGSNGNDGLMRGSSIIASREDSADGMRSSSNSDSYPSNGIAAYRNYDQQQQDDSAYNLCGHNQNNTTDSNACGHGVAVKLNRLVCSEVNDNNNISGDNINGNSSDSGNDARNSKDISNGSIGHSSGGNEKGDTSDRDSLQTGQEWGPNTSSV